MNLQKISSWAAYLSAVAGFGSLIVTFGLIGPATLANPALLVELAQRNPMPVLLQDGIKFISVVLALVLIAALYGCFRPIAPKYSLLAAVCGVGSVLALLVNASLSLYATTQASSLAQGEQLNALIDLLGMLSIFLIVTLGGPDGVHNSRAQHVRVALLAYVTQAGQLAFGELAM
jgi:hypothetical protein